MYQILPHLYLACYSDAKKSTPDFFVVNCTKDLYMIHSDGIRLPVDDNGSNEAMQTMGIYLPAVVDIIHDHISSKRNVVVHCLAGRQRSASVIAAYLMKYHGYTLETAIQSIRETKPDALWDVNFREPLEAFEQSLRN